MTTNGILQLLVYLAALVVLAKPLGTFMARVFQREKTFLDPLLGPVERLMYRLAHINPDEEMDWKQNAVAFLLFNFAGFIIVYSLCSVCSSSFR